MSCTYYTVCSVTYNPRPFSSVGLRTTRSLLTASERSTAIGMTTGMIGTTAGRGGKSELCGQASAHFHTSHILSPTLKLNLITKASIVAYSYTLTPAYKWYSNKELSGGLAEDNDQLLKHEHSLCPHEHHSCQRKIVDQNWHKYTASVDTCSVNTTHKDNHQTK